MKDYQTWLHEIAASSPNISGQYGNVQQTGAVTNRMNMLGKSLTTQNHMNFRRKVNMILRSLNVIPFENQQELQKAMWRAYMVVRQGNIQGNEPEGET